ncbi:MAG: PqqD family protein, partial [Acidimicrobiales bacterium]
PRRLNKNQNESPRQGAGSREESRAGGGPSTPATFVTMTTYRRAQGVLSEELDGRAALVNSEGTELTTLNEVGSVVWAALEREQELTSLVRAVEVACAPVEADTVRRDISEFLDELCALGLVIRT